MPEIYVNNNSVSTSITSSDTLDTLVKKLISHDNKMVITSIILDGIEFDFSADQSDTQSISDFNEIKVFTKSVQELLLESITYGMITLNQLKDLLKEMSTFVSQGNNEEFSQHLLTFIDTFELVLDLFVKINNQLERICESTTNDVKNGFNKESILSELSLLLKDLLNAKENQNHARVGDIIQYEFVDLIDKMSDHLLRGKTFLNDISKADVG